MVRLTMVAISSLLFLKSAINHGWIMVKTRGSTMVLSLRRAYNRGTLIFDGSLCKKCLNPLFYSSLLA